MSIKYALKPNFQFPYNPSQLSKVIKNTPISYSCAKIESYPDKWIYIDHTECNLGFLYQTVNLLTRLNLHQPPKRVFENTILETSYQQYVSDTFHPTRQRFPVFTMDEDKYRALFYKLISKGAYKKTQTPLNITITPSLIDKANRLIERATNWFTRQGFIESNMDLSCVDSLYIQGGIHDFLCQDGVYVLRTTRKSDSDNSDNINSYLTHALIQNILCKMSGEYPDISFRRFGIYNTYMNKSYEYSLDDVPKDFIDFIYDIHAKGVDLNERIEVF